MIGRRAAAAAVSLGGSSIDRQGDRRWALLRGSGGDGRKGPEQVPLPPPPTTLMLSSSSSVPSSSDRGVFVVAPAAVKQKHGGPPPPAAANAATHTVFSSSPRALPQPGVVRVRARRRHHCGHRELKETLPLLCCPPSSLLCSAFRRQLSPTQLSLHPLHTSRSTAASAAISCAGPKRGAAALGSRLHESKRTGMPQKRKLSFAPPSSAAAALCPGSSSGSPRAPSPSRRSARPPRPRPGGVRKTQCCEAECGDCSGSDKRRRAPRRRPRRCSRSPPRAAAAGGYARAGRSAPPGRGGGGGWSAGSGGGRERGRSARPPAAPAGRPGPRR